MPVRSRAVSLVALFVAVVGCGACSEPSPADQGPAGQPTTTAATTTTSSPPTTPISATTTAAHVTVPPEATKHTTEGAQAFAVFYVQQMDNAVHQADSSALRALSDPGCTGCRVAIAWADQLQEKGQHHRTPTLTIAGTWVTPYSTDQQPVVDVLVDDSGGTTVDSAGRVVRTSAPAKFTLRQSLQWRGTSWLVVKSVLVR